MMCTVFLLPLAALLLAGALASPVHALLITEFMAINDATTADEDGDYADWLEVHNDGAAPVDLGGYYLTDSAEDLGRWQLPAVILPAGGYLRVWASDKDRSDPSGPLHTNFKLSGSGEYLALVDPDASTVVHEYAPTFPEQRADISWGLASDLSTKRCFRDPTPGAPNDESRGCSFVEDLQFSAERGFYETPFSVEITTPTPGATIRYTLDASTPSETNGTVYTGPISVTTTTTLRAIAFKAGVESTSVVTQTYIFLDDVLTQSIDDLPATYPDRWGGGILGVTADYDMDPDVVNNPFYAPTMKDDLTSVRTMSLVMDVDDLFGAENGIYTHTTASGREWERPVSVELIHPDGTPGFQINAGIRIYGNTSRSAFNRKHNLRLYFRSIYGPSKLVYPFFEDSAVDTFDEISLTAGNQDTWTGDGSEAQYIRDTYSKDVQLDLIQPAPHVTYVHLYLNGLYWGLYRPTERAVAGFMAENFGGDEDDWDVIRAHGSSDTVIDGTKDAWNTMRDLAKQGLESQANYQALLEYLDVESFIAYAITAAYTGAWDVNWYAGRRRQPGETFKFFIWDAEQSLDGIRRNGTTNLGSGGVGSIYDRLRNESEEFRVLFGDRLHRHFFNDGAMTAKNATARFLERSQEIDRAIVGESARWGDKGSSGPPYTRDEEWVLERQWLLWAYFPGRSATVLEHFRDKGLYQSVTAPAFSQHGGDFPAGFQLAMSAPEGTVYYTDDGSDPRLTGGSVSPSAQVYSLPLALTEATRIRSRARVGGTWSALNDARFVPETPLRVSEMMYHAPGGSELDFIELRNIGSTPLDLAGLRFTDGIEFVFPSIPLDPGTQILVVSDVGAFEVFYGGGFPIAGQYNLNLSNGGEGVRLEDAQGNLIHEFTYDDAWHPSTDGGGYSLVIRDPAGDKSLWEEASGWRPSTFLDGSPGEAELPLCGDGVDNDGDGKADYPVDPGCADPVQDFEDAACDDGEDNDGDGEVDLGDAECTSGSRNSEEANPIDAFLFYRIRGNREGPRFQSFPITLSDLFDADAHFSVTRQKELALPGALNKDGLLTLNEGEVLDPATHLESYQIRYASGQPKHVPRSGLRVENTFGPLVIDTKKVERLLVPTAKDPNGPVSAPEHGAHELDSYKCYRVRITSGTPKYLPRETLVSFEDQFERRNYSLKKLKHFCTPVDPSGEGIKAPDRFLMCYSAKADRREPKHVRQKGLHIANLFGQELVDTIKEAELCVPTRLINPPAPG